MTQFNVGDRVRIVRAEIDPSLVEGDMSRYPTNDDPFAKWNDPMLRGDPFAPWNDPMRRADPFACWNDPFGRGAYEDDVKRYR